MDIDPDLLRQLLAVFRAELEEKIQSITQGLLRLEGTSAPQDRVAVLDGMFRDAHNVKGAARGVDLTDIAELAHALETLFSGLKRLERPPAPAQVDLCLSALDAMRELADAHQGRRLPDADLAALLAGLAESGAADGTAPPRPEPPAAPAPSPPPGGPTAPAGAGTAESVRIGVDKLDRIATLAEEVQESRIQAEEHQEALRLLRSQLGQFHRLWGQALPAWRGSDTSRLPPELHRLFSEGMDLVSESSQMSERILRGARAGTQQLRTLAGTLQDEARRLRLVPAAGLLRPLARTARDTARELGKQAELVIEGEDLEVDRAVLEGLRHPLTHLLLNALDHGIEPPAERRARGKDETGLIRIALRREGGRIDLSVSDDGAGISLDRVRERASSQGLADPRTLASMDEPELLELLFRPGFSTKAIITEVSGRGVGLDVVRTNLQSLKGHIRIESTPGGGTQFRLEVPLTLAGDHGMLVRCAGQVLAIPSNYVERILELRPEQVVDLEGGQAVVLEGRTVPLRDLARILELPSTPSDPKEALQVVVVSRGWRMAALRVDDVIGEREMVVKPLAPPLRSVRNVSGGALGRAGEVVLVLDVSDLVASALRPGAAARVLERGAPQGAVRIPRILVADDSITTRTLEASILEGAGYRVATVTDGREAWELLQRESFDLVVSDVEMPSMDGFELARRIKESPRHQGIPVVIVTSLASEADRQRGIEVGADAYIVKARFETRALLEVVEQLV